MFKKFYIALLVFYSTVSVVIAQNNRILLYTKNSNEIYAQVNILAIEKLQNTAASKHFELVSSNNPNDFSENNLANFKAVVFLNASINTLDFRQSAELERFMKAGGGFVGIHATAEAHYQWLWFEKMMQGKLAENQLQNPAQYSLITNAFIGKTTLPLLWKIDDKPLLFKQLPVSCKPILLDIMGKTWAWHNTAEQGGKFFYTAFGGQISAFQNENFINHLWAGIEEVSPKTSVDYQKIAASALPLENRFLKQSLATNLTDAVSMEVTSKGSVLIFEQAGNIKLFSNDNKQLKNIGFLPNSQAIQSIKLDPEYDQNGYVYTFEPQGNEFLIKRFQVMGDSVAVITDFSSQSASLPDKSVKYQFSNFEASPYRLPQYYNNKIIKYSPEQGLIIETYKEEELLNVEPFLDSEKFNFIKDLAIGINGELLVLEGTQLLKVDYAEKNRKPQAKASADIYEGTAPLTVNFSSAESMDFDKNDTLSFQWEFDNTHISNEENPVFTYQLAGEYWVNLKVTDTQGESDSVRIRVKVNKGNIKRKK